jgi:bifunctional UDP-N-acetylglucosamine pyrophosphorylase/glucosamine-1-phosphate N-acetyltransferase
MMAAPTALLKRWVMALKNDNAQREYYLTDIVADGGGRGRAGGGQRGADETEVLGVNSPLQLADLERRFQRRQAEALMEAGVRLADPARFDQRGTLQPAAGRGDRRRLRVRGRGDAGRRRAHRRALRDPQRAASPPAR